MQASTRPRGRHPLFTLVVMTLLFTQCLFALAQISSVFLSRELWAADLANFIRLHLLIASAGLFLVGLLMPSRATRIGGLFVLAAGVFPYTLLPPQAPYLGGTSFTLVSANVQVENRDPSRLLSIPDIVSTDILVLQEMRRVWQTALIESGHWAHESDRNLRANTDMKVLSRFPILDERTISPESTDTGGRHPLRLELMIGEQIVILYAVHAQTPRSQDMWRERAAYFRDLEAALLSERADAAVVVAGDWNTPTWSPLMLDLLERTGYRNTEPRWWPLATRFSIRFWSITQLGSPVDRVIVSPNVGLEDVRTGPKFGSDHLPVIVRLSIP